MSLLTFKNLFKKVPTSSDVQDLLQRLPSEFSARQSAPNGTSCKPHAETSKHCQPLRSPVNTCNSRNWADYREKDLLLQGGCSLMENSSRLDENQKFHRSVPICQSKPGQDIAHHASVILNTSKMHPAQKILVNGIQICNQAMFEFHDLSSPQWSCRFVSLFGQHQSLRTTLQLCTAED